MSDTPTSAAPNSDPEYDTFAALERRRADLAEAIRPANKTALFDALIRAGVARVVVHFDGCGDSGQIESVEASAADGTAAALDVERIPILRARCDGSATDAQELPLTDAVEALAYDLLEQTHAGWEDGEGAFGAFTFDVVARSITLEYNARVIETVSSEHAF